MEKKKRWEPPVVMEAFAPQKAEDRTAADDGFGRSRPRARRFVRLAWLQRWTAAVVGGGDQTEV